jgi:hypothetical protein
MGVFRTIEEAVAAIVAQVKGEKERRDVEILTEGGARKRGPTSC